MSKEQQELVGDAYNNYGKRMVDIMNVVIPAEFKDKGWVKLNLDYQGKYDVLSQEEFINKIKTDSEFSEKWGLSIQERELDWEERRDLLTPEQYDGTALNKYGRKDCGFGYISPFTDKVIHYWMNLHNIPTKLIKLTYNNQTIESYE